MSDQTPPPQRPDSPEGTGATPAPGSSSPHDTAPNPVWPGYPGAAQAGPPPFPPPGASQPAAPHPRRNGGLLVAVGAVALVVGLVAGGVGGTVGYELGRTGSSPSNALGLPVPGARPAANLPNGSAEQVAQKVTPSVVQIRVRGPQGAGEGSGIVLSSDGLILTNNHVVEAAADGGEAEAVFQDGHSTPIEIVGRAPSFDLAVVRANGASGLTTAELGRSDDVLVGQEVLAIGSPLGLSGTVTAGIVSALNRPVRAGGEGSGQDTVLDALQTDAAINPGNSGGPLVDMSGRVIGVNSAIASLGGSGQQAGSIGLGFAIPIDQARRIADELIRTGKATQARLGVSVPASSAEGGGAVIQEVVPNSAADQAGIKPADTVTKVDDRVIDSGDALVAAIRSYPPGAQVRLTVKDRSGSVRQVPVTLGSQEVGAG
ncbi:MAG TPA: trypsin-like peptidase domain-containing protein [Pseudonocardiaceae bacterium]|nr:trypsin-like peptidase domain-containing protein [Pseudonocardiaceae bacterium]